MIGLVQLAPYISPWPKAHVYVNDQKVTELEMHLDPSGVLYNIEAWINTDPVTQQRTVYLEQGAVCLNIGPNVKPSEMSSQFRVDITIT